MKDFLKIEKLDLYYEKHRVLKNVNFALKAGELLCILGPSGCGKTSLLRTLAGFENAFSGEITLQGKTLFSNKTNLAPEKRKIGFVFQDLALFPHLTVEENVTFGLTGRDKQKKKKICDRLLQIIGLSEYPNYYPHQLSGGQKQRVALARSLAPEPSLLLLDEPFSSLDEDLAEELSLEFREIIKEANMTAVMVTHNQAEAFSIADKIAVMNEGVLEQISTAEDLYQKPASENIARFIGEGFFLECIESKSGYVKTALGEVKVSQRDDRIDADRKMRIFVRPEQVVVSEFKDGLSDTANRFTDIRYMYKGENYLGYAKIGQTEVAFYSKVKKDAVELALCKEFVYKVFF
jgi:iron(III) transport system ATP-binding protein